MKGALVRQGRSARKKLPLCVRALPVPAPCSRDLAVTSESSQLDEPSSVSLGTRGAHHVHTERTVER